MDPSTSLDLTYNFIPSLISLNKISKLNTKNLTPLTPIKIYPNADISKQEIIKDNKNRSGVYLWINNLNNKIYVGSSTNLGKRLSNYFNLKYLQNASKSSIIYSTLLKNKHLNFSLYILEYCESSELANREQYYFDLLSPEYNILKIAHSSLGFRHSKSTINKLIENNSKSIKLRVTNTLTNKETTYASIREASRQLSLKEGFSIIFIYDKIRRDCLKNGTLLLGKYKFEQIIKDKGVNKEVLIIKSRKNIQAILNHPKTIPIKLTNIITNQIHFFISIREAARTLSSVENMKIETLVKQLSNCLKNSTLLLGKYKVDTNR